MTILRFDNSNKRDLQMFYNNKQAVLETTRSHIVVIPLSDDSGVQGRSREF